MKKVIYFNGGFDGGGGEFSLEALDAQLGVGDVQPLDSSFEGVEGVFSDLAIDALERDSGGDDNKEGGGGNGDQDQNLIETEANKSGDLAAQKVKDSGGSEEEQRLAKEKAISDYKKIHDIPEHLKGIKDIIANPLETSDETDYSSKLKDEFGFEKQDATRDDYENHVIRVSSKEAFIKKAAPQFDALKRIADGDVSREDTVSTYITNRLKGSGIVNKETIDSNVSSMFEDGKLNEAGNAEFARIQMQAKDYIKNVESKAEEFVNKKIEDRTAELTALESVSKDLNILGVEIDSELSEFLLAKAKLNNGVKWVTEQNLTPQESAKRRLLLELISNENALARFIREIDRKGELYGLSSKNKKK